MTRLDALLVLLATCAIGACDVVVGTPKMWAIEAIAPTLKPLLAKDTAVIPVQNGIDAPAMLARVLGWDHVVYGSASMNAALEEPGVIRQQYVRGRFVAPGAWLVTSSTPYQIDCAKAFR